MQKEENNELKISCPYCSAPYTAKMKTDFYYSTGSVYTGMYGEGFSIEIYCSNCKRLVYKKNSDYESSCDETDESYEIK